MVNQNKSAHNLSKASNSLIRGICVDSKFISGPFSFTCAQGGLSYQLIYVPWLAYCMYIRNGRNGKFRKKMRGNRRIVEKQGS